MKPLVRPFAALLFTAAFLHADDAVEIKVNWQTGKSYNQSMVMDQTSKMEIAGQKMDQSVKATTDTTISVAAGEGAGKVLTLSYGRMLVETSMNGAATTLDSSKGGDANPIAAMTKMKIKLHLNESNDVTKVEGLDGAGALGTNPILKGFLNEETLKQTVKSGTLASFPNKPVKPGESWPFVMNIPIPQIGKISIKGSYKYEGSDKRDGVDCAKLSLDAKAEADLGGAPAGDSNDQQAAMIKQLGMKISEMTLKGTIWWDTKLGFMRGAEQVQDMTMQMTPPGAKEPMKIPMHQVINTKLTSVEDTK